MSKQADHKKQTYFFFYPCDEGVTILYVHGCVNVKSNYFSV